MIQQIKLISGDYIVGSVQMTEDGSYLVNNPMLVTELKEEATDRNVMLLNPYFNFPKTDMCVFKDSHVIAIADIHEELIKFYCNSLSYYKDKVEPKLLREMKKANISISDAKETELIILKKLDDEGKFFINPDNNKLN